MGGVQDMSRAGCHVVIYTMQYVHIHTVEIKIDSSDLVARVS